MEATAELPAWRILPSAEGRFIWTPAADNRGTLAAISPLKFPIRRAISAEPPLLPSVSKLLAEGAALDGRAGNEVGNLCNSNGFQTASEPLLGSNGKDVPKIVANDPTLDKENENPQLCFRIVGPAKEGSFSNHDREKTSLYQMEGDRSENLHVCNVQSPPSSCQIKFRTAGGRSLPISDDAMRRAKILLGNDGCETLETKSSTIVSIPLVSNHSLHELSYNKEKLHMANKSLERKTASESPCCQIMFHTAGGRSLPISDDAMRRAKIILGDDDCETLGTKSSTIFPIPSVPNDRINGISRKKENLHFMDKSLEKRKSDEHLHVGSMHESPASSLQIKFHTAGGKSLPISEDAMRRAKILLGDDICETLDTKRSAIFSIPSVSNDNLHRISHNKENLHSTYESLEKRKSNEHLPVSSVCESPPSSHQIKFHTAGGRSLPISADAMRRAKTLLGDDGPEASETICSSILSIPSVSDDNNENLHVIDKSLNRKRANEHLQFSNMHEAPPSSHQIKFHTAGGRSLPISADAMRRAKILLGDDDHEASETKNSTIFSVPSVLDDNNEKLYVIDKSLNRKRANEYLQVSNMHETLPSSHRIKFHTAGGRSLPISADAMRRAKVLLGDDGCETSETNSSTSFSTPSVSNAILQEISHDKENLHFIDKNMERKKPNGLQINVHEASFMLSSRNADSAPGKSISKSPFVYERTSRLADHMLQDMPRRNLADAFEEESLKTIPEARPPRPPLADISNRQGAHVSNQMHFSGIKRRQLRANSVSPFKRPRSTRFSAPLCKNLSSIDTGKENLLNTHALGKKTHISKSKFISAGHFSASSAKASSRKLPISSHYPSCCRRKTLLEFFRGPPTIHARLESISDEAKHMNPSQAVAHKFKSFPDCKGIGADDLQDFLIQAGASSLSATKEWVQNHYKWIVWKLACLERSYPKHAGGKYLTPSNVLEELKYRYEREVNHGHRSALKRIMEGDAASSSMLILCISAIHPPFTNTKSETAQLPPEHDADKSHGMKSDARKIELTDGWYSINANLDSNLSKLLASGKLFAGQKLRICGAVLLGWAGPIPPLEAAKSVSLQIFRNGTYRAQWAERLGFCKGFRFPLAFKCIKAGGGPVPKTLIGIMRIYPVLYKERLSDGGTVVRSERMESKILHLRNQRRQSIVEDIMSKQEKFVNDIYDDGDEGAKILKMLEESAEPEVLMADMSPQQLISISNYQAKSEEIKQSAVVKKIEAALEEAKLGSRDVTPFMRVRVAGLNPKDSSRKCSPPFEGLITIWNPTEQQRVDLIEGQMFSVSGLTPLNVSSDLLHLHTRGAKSTWKPLPPSAKEHFEPFFNPRHAAQLLTFGQLPLSRDFDIAGVILHVGEVFSSSYIKKQWVFLTDGSFNEHRYHLLAINVCLPSVDSDPSAFLSPMLSGSTVCFYNLVKKGRDEANHLWLADATENSIWSQSSSGATGSGLSSHLKESAARVKKWADTSSLELRKLRAAVMNIVNGG